MIGTYERRLIELSTAPQYDLDKLCDDTARLLDRASETWSAAAAVPGWTGKSAEAATTLFLKRSDDSSTNAQVVRKIRDIVSEANFVLESTAQLISSLPDARIEDNVRDALLVGISSIVTGYGSIDTAYDYFNYGKKLLDARESAAQKAYNSIQNRLDALSHEVTLFMASATVTSSIPISAIVTKKQKPSLSEILKEYQVEEDPNGMVDWNLKGFNRWLAEKLGLHIEDKQITSGEGDLLDELDIWGQRDFKDIYTESFSQSEDRYSVPTDADGNVLNNSDINDNHVDAYRHAYWNALMTKRYGANWASMYGTSHEGIPENSSRREAMDLYNNEVGRKIAKDNPWASEEKLADLVYEAVENGDMIVIDKAGELAWSDLPKDKTGQDAGGIFLDGRPGQDFVDETLS